MREVKLGAWLSAAYDSAVRSLTGAQVTGAALVALGLLQPQASGAADKLYYFVDEHGTPHFSNVPADKRYRPYATITEDGGTQYSAPAPQSGAPVQSGVVPVQSGVPAHRSQGSSVAQPQHGSPAPAAPAMVRASPTIPVPALSPLQEDSGAPADGEPDPELGYDQGEPVEVDNPSGAPQDER